jgi:hypothetical protein
VRPIRFANRTVALGGDALLLAPEIAALEPDHPTRRFVWMLCAFSAEVDAGTASDGCAATRRARPSIARGQLMPDELFRPLAHRPDHDQPNLRHPPRGSSTRPLRPSALTSQNEQATNCPRRPAIVIGLGGRIARGSGTIRSFGTTAEPRRNRNERGSRA